MKYTVVKRGMAIFLAVLVLMTNYSVAAYASSPVNVSSSDTSNDTSNNTSNNTSNDTNNNTSNDTAAVGSNFFAIGYTMTKPGTESSVSNIRKNEVVDITVTLKDTSVSSDSINMDDYDFSKLVDSFSGSNPTVLKDSSGSGPLILKVKFSGLKYSGTGQSLKVQISKKGNSSSYQTTEINIAEAVVYEEPVKKELTPNAPYAVLISRSPIGKPISSGEVIGITVFFKNAGKTKLISPVASFSSSEELMITNDVSTFLLPDIEAGKSASVNLNVKASKKIISANQFLNVDLKYSYDFGGTMTQESISDKLNISANATDGNTTDKIDAPVPNIIIRNFSYGDGSVAAGSKFDLNFDFENKGKLKVENIVVTVDGGESFTVDGSTNTFFYESLKLGSSQKQEVPMQALTTAKSGAQSIGVTFSYEYVDNKKRSSASANIKISVPVSQPDRFHVNAPIVPKTTVVGEEIALTLAYVNKGKGEISNVEAIVESKKVDSPARMQYIGNIAAGGSGTIGFALTPNTMGDIDAILKVTYENSDQQLQTKEFPVKFNAKESTADETSELHDMSNQEEGKKFPGFWLAVGIVTILSSVIIVVVKKKRSKKIAIPTSADWNSWNDPDPSETDEEYDENTEV